MDKKHLQTALILLFLICVPLSHTFARDRDSGDKMKLPETTEFAKKVNKFLEPVSFGVGTEPGYNKNSVYLYLMYDYMQDYSWMVKLKIESDVSTETTLDIDDGEDDKYLQISKMKSYELYIQPWIRHFEYCDLGLGVFLEYLQDDVEGAFNSGSTGLFLEGKERMFFLGPLITFQWEYPVFKHVDMGLITELIPVGAVWYDYDGETTLHTSSGTSKEKDYEKLNGYSFPYVSQTLYFTFLKFLNLSTSASYEYFNAGGGDVVVHDTILRCGAAILKRPKSGFLNFLVGVYYENEWTSSERLDGHSWDHESRWLFCIGASG